MRVRVLKIPAAFLRAAGLLVFPSVCKRCARFLERPGEKVVCTECLAGLRPWPGAKCGSCGRFLDSAESRPLCLSCLTDPPPCRIHRSSGVYTGVLKDLILLLKYKDYAVLGPALAGFLYDSLWDDAEIWRDADVLLPVPLHPKRERERGFNQSLIIARELGRKTGIPVDNGCLVKTRNAPPQTSLEAKARAGNVHGAFRVKKPARIAGKKVVLVDDVCTTGSTLRACGEALLEAGVQEVRALTLARTL